MTLGASCTLSASWQFVAQPNLNSNLNAVAAQYIDRTANSSTDE
jgi:hypothetical protein